MGRFVTLICLLSVLFLAGCHEKFIPRPRGFIRIDLPAKSYSPLQGNFPYSFEIPDYSVVLPDDRNKDKPLWINISVPDNKAEVHISYFLLPKQKSKKNSELAGYMEESRELAYKHSIKADAIDENIFINHAKKVYGTVYYIKGNAASPMQFYLTDSVDHFLRGALYIRSRPDIDSLRPVIDFLEKDVRHLIETTSWK